MNVAHPDICYGRPKVEYCHEYNQNLCLGCTLLKVWVNWTEANTVVPSGVIPVEEKNKKSFVYLTWTPLLTEALVVSRHLQGRVLAGCYLGPIFRAFILTSTRRICALSSSLEELRDTSRT